MMYAQPKSEELMSKRITIICKRCGTPKECYPSQARQFCSIKCKNESADRVKFTCVTCQKNVEMLESVFRGQGKQTFTCSPACYRELIKKNRIKKCASCKQEFTPADARTLTCSPKCRKQYCRDNSIRKKSGSWMENGYRVLYVDGDDSIKEHIHIAQVKYGRKLEKDEVVHHINGIKLDNRPENLQIMKRRDHTVLHRKQEYDAAKFVHWLNQRFQEEKKLQTEEIKQKLIKMCPGVTHDLNINKYEN